MITIAEAIKSSIDTSRRRDISQATMLGGVSGPNGGSGIPFGGMVGKLIQSRVAYDSTEDATLYTPSGASLLDNLNHMRYNINLNTDNIEVLSGIVSTISGGGGSSTLAGLTDVHITTPTNNQALVYLDGYWTNSTISTSGGGNVTYSGGRDHFLAGDAVFRQPAASGVTVDYTVFSGVLADRYVSYVPGVYEETTYQDSSGSLTYVGAWDYADYTGSYGVIVRQSNNSALPASVSVTFTGTKVSVYYIGNGGGYATTDMGIYIDNVNVAHIDTYSMPSAATHTDFTVERGTHTIKVQIDAPGYVFFDKFVCLDEVIGVEEGLYRGSDVQKALNILDQHTHSGYLTSSSALLLDTSNGKDYLVYSDTSDPTGFVNRTSSALSFDDSTRTFTISGTFNVYINGTRYTKTTESKQINTTNGVQFLYYTTAGLQVSDSHPGFDKCLVATVYWNNSFAKGLLGDERHGTMQHKTHEYLHETVGTRYAYGLGGTFSDSAITIGNGEYYDEDIEFILSEKTSCRILYKNGSTNYEWTTTPQTFAYLLNGANIRCNNGNALADVGANAYVAYWIFATNDPAYPIVSLMGQRTDVNIGDARNNNTFSSLVLGTLPFAEMKLLYRVIFRNAASKYQETTDYRTVSSLSTSNFVATDHGTLTGLNDLDHPASAIIASTTNFNGKLSSADDTVQKALDTLDDHNHVHDALTSVTLAGVGVSYGHISNSLQSIAGMKIMTDYFKVTGAPNGAMTGAGIEFANNAGYCMIMGYDRGVGGGYMPMYFDCSYFMFYTNGSQKIQLDTNGNFGIGYVYTDTIEQKLQVEGNIKLGKTDATKSILFDNGTANDAGLRYNSTSDKMEFTDNGVDWYAIKTREKLTSARTYYVATTGSDTNTGLAVGTPFLTVQKAIDVISDTLDMGAYNVTVLLADGTYTITASNICKQCVGAGRVIIQGNSTTPANVVISLNSAGIAAFYSDGVSTLYDIRYLKIMTNGTKAQCDGLYAINSSYLAFTGIEFSTGLTRHMQSLTQSKIMTSASYKITGNATYHLLAQAGGFIQVTNSTVTNDSGGAITWAGSFVQAQQGGIIRLYTTTAVGVYSGYRFLNYSNGILVGSGIPDQFGSIAGLNFTGAQSVA